MQEHATACLGHDRGFLVTTECRKCQDRLLLVLGRGRGILVATEFLSGSVSQHGSQILSHRNCHNMGVLVLSRDDVATEVSLSRPRRSRREVRAVTGAWLRPRDFSPGQKIVVSLQDFMEWCHDRVSYVVTEFWPRPKGLLS